MVREVAEGNALRNEPVMDLSIIGVTDDRFHTDSEDFAVSVVPIDPYFLDAIAAILIQDPSVSSVDLETVEVVVRDPLRERAEGRIRGHFAHGGFLILMIDFECFV
jgi:hypothetical protein